MEALIDPEKMSKSARILAWTPYLLANYANYVSKFLKDDVYAVFLRGSLAGEIEGILYGQYKGRTITHPDIDLVFITKNFANRMWLQDLWALITDNAPNIPKDVLDIEKRFEYEVHQGNVSQIDDVLSDMEKLRELEGRIGRTPAEDKLIDCYKDGSKRSTAINRGVILYQKPLTADSSDSQKRLADYLNYRRKWDAKPLTFNEYIDNVWLPVARDIKAEGRYDEDFKKALKAARSAGPAGLMKKVLDAYNS